MKVKLLFAAILAIASCGATTLTVDSSVDDVLDALDARGKDLKTLTADVKTSDIDTSIGEAGDIRKGKLDYQILKSGDSRWHALFDKKITGHKLEAVKHEWSYADGKLIDRDYQNKTQKTTQILKPGEKMQLFNLDGPFPLPLGQDKADVHKHFQVEKEAVDKDDPAGTIHLQLTPVAGTDMGRKFSKIDVWVDPKTNMPVRISVVDPDQKSEKQTDLTNTKVNEPLNDGDFEMEKVDLDKGWALTDGGSKP